MDRWGASTLDNPVDSILIGGILSRHSVHPKRLVDPAPDSKEIALIVSAAITTADHCGLRPWRFIAITGDSRAALGEVFAEIKIRRELDISVSELERERDRARAVPAMIAVISRLVPDHPLVPVSEQYASIGGAIQNMLLCTHGLGFGAKMVSGRKIQDPQLASVFRLSPDEALFGFLCLGTPQSISSKKQRASVDESLAYWQPEAVIDEPVSLLTSPEK